MTIGMNAFLLPRDSRPSRPQLDDVDVHVERARAALIAAMHDATERRSVAPTCFLAETGGFAGLAFARELRRVSPPGVPLVGCEARNVVACALLAVGNDSCRALLDLEYDPAREVPLLVVDARVRLVTLAREDWSTAAPRRG
jgi:hypothetical protein